VEVSLQNAKAPLPTQPERPISRELLRSNSKKARSRYLTLDKRNPHQFTKAVTYVRQICGSVIFKRKTPLKRLTRRLTPRIIGTTLETVDRRMRKLTGLISKTSSLNPRLGKQATI